MVTYNYFFCYVLLLVLQVSGPLYAQEPLETSPSPQVDPKQVETTISAPSTPSICNTTAGLQEVNSTTSVDSTADVPNSTTGTENNQDVNTTNEKISISNIDPDPVFPQVPRNGTKIFCTDRIMDTPPEVNTNTSANAESLQVTANRTKIKCPTDMNLDVSNLNTTEVKTNSTNKIDTEVTGLLQNDLKETHNASEISALPPNITFNANQSIDNEVEYIEDGRNTEEVLMIKSAEGSSIPAVPLVQGQLAAILAGVFVVISVIAYFGLLSWRRYLENRYGNRQMLINEDEFNDRDDMRHFSI